MLYLHEPSAESQHASTRASGRVVYRGSFPMPDCWPFHLGSKRTAVLWQSGDSVACPFSTLRAQLTGVASKTITGIARLHATPVKVGWACYCVWAGGVTVALPVDAT